jgi:hypothetical protein
MTARDGRAALAVADRVGEAVDSDEGGAGRIRQSAVGVEGDGAVGTIGGGRNPQRIAVGVAVITQHVDGERSSLVDPGRVVRATGQSLIAVT